MLNTPPELKVRTMIQQFTKSTNISPKSKLEKDLHIGSIDCELLRQDLESTFGIEIPHGDILKWKKVKNVVSCVTLCIQNSRYK